jgi:hypothetical protein
VNGKCLCSVLGKKKRGTKGEGRIYAVKNRPISGYLAFSVASPGQSHFAQ